MDQCRDTCRARAEEFLKTETRFSDVRIAQSVAGRSVSGALVETLIRRAKSNPKPTTAREFDFLDPPPREYPKDLGLFGPVDFALPWTG